MAQESCNLREFLDKIIGNITYNPKKLLTPIKVDDDYGYSRIASIVLGSNEVPSIDTI